MYSIFEQLNIRPEIKEEFYKLANHNIYIRNLLDRLNTRQDFVNVLLEYIIIFAKINDDLMERKKTEAMLSPGPVAFVVNVDGAADDPQCKARPDCVGCGNTACVNPEKLSKNTFL